MRQTLQKLNTRLLALAVAAMLLLCMAPAVSAAEASGQCGDSLTWSFSGDTLVISGSGAMYDYPESTMAPWYDYRYQIAAVSFPSGLTRVGDLAFYDCSALSSVTLPGSVTEVGWHAFDGCTAMTMLELGGNLRIIEDSAFKDCTSLKAIRLPGTLTTIGFQAFYRCASLTEVTVPASVTDFGMTVFAFCYSLVRADIQAPLTVLPDWTFYGCEMLADLTLPATLTGADPYAFYDCTGLQNVEYSGSSENMEQIRADIDRDLEVGSGLISVGDIPNGDTSSNSVFEETEDGVVSNSTTITQTDNATVSTNTTVVYPEGNVDNSSIDIQVDITLENSDGWNEVAGYLNESIDKNGSASVDVYVKDNSDVPADILSGLAGKDATITIHTASGVVWQVDCSTLTADTLENDYGFTYSRTDATEEQLALLGTAVGYQISFDRDAQINAEVMIRLPAEHSQAIATLCQVNKKDLTQLQSVVVDYEGYAHFYLGAVDSETVYLIGIDIPGVETSAALVPENLHNSYGITDSESGIEYVITGRTSSWGMSIGQVSWILAGVMVVCVVGVGVFMFALNKRKLRQGYVPDLGEDEEEI